MKFQPGFFVKLDKLLLKMYMEEQDAKNINNRSEETREDRRQHAPLIPSLSVKLQ